MLNKELTNLGLAKRANVLITGTDFVYDALLNNKVCYVYLASDLSKTVKDKFLYLLNLKQIAYNLNYTAEELSNAIGSARKVIALSLKGKSFLNILRK